MVTLNLGYSLIGDLITTDPEIEEDLNVSSGRFSLGLTAFGFRYFVTDMFGINMELNLGAPYIFSGGLNLKF